MIQQGQQANITRHSDMVEQRLKDTFILLSQLNQKLIDQRSRAFGEPPTSAKEDLKTVAIGYTGRIADLLTEVEKQLGLAHESVDHLSNVI